MTLFSFFPRSPRRPGPDPLDGAGAPDPTGARLAAAALAAVLAAAFMLRFYQLGAPTFWFDEMWTALISRQDLGYIVDYALRFDQHPPLQNILFKLFCLLGADDFAARSLYGAAGVGAVWLVYRIGADNFSSGAGLAGAAFLAVNYSHVWISRTVRVYSLVVFCFAVIVWMTLRQVRRGDRFGYVALALACLLLCSLHHVGLLLAFQVMLTLLALDCMRAAPPGKKVRAMARTALTYLAVAAPSLAILAVELAHGATGARFGDRSLAQLLSGLGFTLQKFSMIAQGLPTPALVYAPVVAGVAAALGANLRAGLTVLGFLLGPLAVIFCARYTNGIGFTYVSFLLVPLSVFFGCAVWGLARLCRVPAWSLPSAVIAALCVAGFVFVNANRDHLYVEDNLETRQYYAVGLYKQIARSLVREPALGLTAFGDAFLGGGVNWYLDQFARPNFFTGQSLSGPNRRDFSLLYVHADPELNDFTEKLHRGAASFSSQTGPFYTLVRAAYDPAPLVLDEPVRLFTLDSRPENCLRQASHLHQVSPVPHEHAGLAATSPAGGFVDYAVENARQAGRYTALLSLRYKNQAEAGRLALSCALDDAPFQDVFVSAGRDRADTVFVQIPVDRPFSRMTLRVTLKPDRTTATAGIVNTGLVAYRSLTVSLAELDQADAALTALYAATMPQGHHATPLGRQKILERDGLAVHTGQSPERLTPIDGAQGALVVEAGEAGRAAFFYPRLFGPDDAIFISVVDGENERQIVGLRGDGKAWTPLGMQVPLNLGPAGEKLCIRLFGRAELLTCDGLPLFED